MTERDPDRLEALYEQACALEPQARESFLAQACGGDDALEGELRSLLAHGEQAEAFFTTLADAVVSPSVGHQIGHYRLVGMLGAGGMGTVYRAHDDRLNRIVALKFLPPYLSAQPEARERFLVEARAAAALDHPNVCTIHEIGETADGRAFIAMPCYEGETLKERLSRGPLPPKDAIRIALDLARALGAAHARGIVHRDVKPGNVMLCADGAVRLLDFGVAKVSDLSLTGPGVTPGTIAYMSPEQARGDPVDARTDLWSVGVVLHEMLAGTRPFRGGNDRALMEAIFHGSPDALPKRLDDMPASVPTIVTRLLQKRPANRYQSAEELVRDLTDGGRPRRKAPVVAAGLLGVAALLSLGLLVRRPRPAAAPVDASASSLTIAVLPFTVRGTGLEVWREGMVDLLSMGLDGAAGIRAINNRTLLASWHREIGDSAAADLESALGVARRNHARYALLGTAVAAGPRLRLSADIYDVASGRVVGPVQAEGPSDSVLVLVDRLGMQTLGVILAKNTGDVPTLDLAAFTTNSLLALKAYLEGEEHFRRSEFPEAVDAWARAVRADSLFALADLGESDAYAWIGQYDQFMESLNRAKALADRLPERERALMRIRWDRLNGVPGVLSAIREAIRKYPDAADAWYQLGEVYYHDAPAMGRPEDVEDAFRKAADLQPTMAPYQVHLLELAFVWHPDSAHIANELATYARLAPLASETKAGRIVFALRFGDSAARAGARSELPTLESTVATEVFFLLSHPLFADLRDAVYRAVEPHVKQANLTALRAQRFRSLGLSEGRVRDGLAMLTDPLTPSLMRYGGPLYLSVRGMPVPEGALQQALAAARSDSALYSNRVAASLAAATAARLGDWGTYNEFVSRMRSLAERGRATGDAASAAYWDWAVGVSEAHGLWRHGRKEEALRRFETTLGPDPGVLNLWTMGQLYLELGRPDQAERAFRAVWLLDGTPSCLQLARILMRTGRAAEAREAYAFVADAWRHADPELQPLVDEARRGAGRMSAERK